MAVEPSTGTKGVVPITAPSTWQNIISMLSAALASQCRLLFMRSTSLLKTSFMQQSMNDGVPACLRRAANLSTCRLYSGSFTAQLLACMSWVRTRISTVPVGGIPLVDSALPLMVVEPPGMTGSG